MKYVYLFELDSVRLSDKEIEIGQKALYDEIVQNGNVVVLTYNQFVDSRGFFSLLDVPAYYENLVALFDKGAIRLSQYGEVRTITQYMLQTLDYDRTFLFCGWPLRSVQKRLLALIKRSLVYSDLTEIGGYMNGTRSDEEILELFVELRGAEACPTTLPLDECKEVVGKLFWLLKTVLRISPIPTIYNPPKVADAYKMTMAQFMQHALMLRPQGDEALWGQAKDILLRLPDAAVGKRSAPIPVRQLAAQYAAFDRSAYHRMLKEAYRAAGSDAVKLPYQYATAIVDMCYNYQLEYSICNASKHYDICEFDRDDPDEWTTFRADFFQRLAQTWDLGEYDRRFMAEVPNLFDEYKPTRRFPDFGAAVRVLEYAERKKATAKTDRLERYEYELKGQRKKHKARVVLSIWEKLLFAVVCFTVAIGVEVFFEFLQNQLETVVKMHSVWWIVLETFTFICVTEMLTFGLSKLLKKLFSIDFLSFSEAVGAMGHLIGDFFRVLMRKATAYTNHCEENVANGEQRNAGSHIDYVRTDAIKKYLAFKRNQGNAALFADSEPNVYPIAELADDESVMDLLRLEELYNYHFGIVYESKYHKVCVDPIATTDRGKPTYFPYERILSATTGVGVVMVTVCKGKLICLRQFRHAPRKMQLSFPRGFGEDEVSGRDNAVKELGEELGVEKPAIKRIEKLGYVSPDSGLTAACVAVYYVEITDYNPAVGEEGIMGVAEYGTEEFERLLWAHSKQRSDFCDDGFTLSAYMLYQLYLRNAKA